MYSAFYDVDVINETLPASTSSTCVVCGVVCLGSGACGVVVCEATQHNSGLELKMIKILESISAVRRDCSHKQINDTTNSIILDLY